MWEKVSKYPRGIAYLAQPLQSVDAVYIHHWGASEGRSLAFPSTRRLIFTYFCCQACFLDGIAWGSEIDVLRTDCGVFRISEPTGALGGRVPINQPTSRNLPTHRHFYYGIPCVDARHSVDKKSVGNEKMFFLPVLFADMF